MESLTQELLTPRLRLRRWRPDDAQPLAAINADPEVTRYLAPPPTAPPTPTGAREFLRRLMRHWDLHGFGLWALESREPQAAGRLLGFAGIAYPTFMPELAGEVEIGWRLARAAWGRGLATEAGLVVREDAFGTHRLSALISIIHPDNLRSRRVAIKLGMNLERHAHNPLLRRQVEVWRVRRPHA
jgi:RimJ/RimL family protein N-acetyltransferase